ncbi:molybdate ABC transporter substrate-binding protein [candidate division WOR-3 bacterium]|nr:molybdate ABC transporter substrate-binding protein [candidate division WOR-3 bacterium]
MKLKSLFFVFSIVSISVLSFTGCEKKTESIQVAVAANYTQPFGEIEAAFEKETGIEIEATFTSSGNLYNQIINGAPYDIFFSADEERPESLFSAGLSEKPFIYARGKVVLWSADANFADSGDWKSAMARENISKIALANPETAPYGTSALIALESAGLAETVSDRIVTAQTIAQAFQYASTEAVDAGFCAYSSVFSSEGEKGSYFFVEEAPPVIQSACLLVRTENRRAVEEFIKFLSSNEVNQINVRYGYE